MAKKKKRRRSPIDPVHILGSARAFQNAALAIYIRYELGSMRIIPTMVCGAMSLEIHLKCLHRVRRRYIEGHDVRMLFDKLSKADKRRIKEIFNRAMKDHACYAEILASGVPLDVESVLTRASNMFVAMRYCYEGKWLTRDSSGWVGNAGVDRLADSIRDLIIELHPEYAERCDDLTLELTEIRLPSTSPLHQMPGPHAGSLPNL